MSATEVLNVGAERAPFVMLPRWLLHADDISDGAKILYGMLHDLVAGREGPTRPVTRGQLAQCCGVSIATVDRRLAELVKAGAVDKQAQFEMHQGQLANVYWVRLSAPAGTVQPPVDMPVDNFKTPRCNSAAPPAAILQPPPLQPCGHPGRIAAAPSQEEQEEELSPPTPRQAGGEDVDGGGVGRRSQGTNLRALGTNPRAEVATAVAEQSRFEADQRAAAIDAEVAARRREAAEAEHLRARAEAEAAAVSAALDDELLHRLLARCRDGLPGPLACSAAGVTRAAVAWCRGAVGEWPGDLATAVRLSLETDWPGPAGVPAPPLSPGPPPPDAEPLVERIRRWLEAARLVGE